MAFSCDEPPLSMFKAKCPTVSLDLGLFCCDPLPSSPSWSLVGVPGRGILILSTITQSFSSLSCFFVMSVRTGDLTGAIELGVYSESSMGTTQKPVVLKRGREREREKRMQCYVVGIYMYRTDFHFFTSNI